MKHLASEQRTIFVSSHLMNEMAVTADHLIVIGKGKLIAESTTQEFIERSSEKSVLVRSPDAGTLADLIAAEGGKATPQDPAEGRTAALTVTGLDAPRIGEIAAANRIVLHELAPQLGSLEEAFHGDDGRQRRVRRRHARGDRRSRPPAPRPPRGAANDLRQPTRRPGPPRLGSRLRPRPAGGLRRPDLLAEWTKIRSVRSTVWTLVIFVVVSLGLTGLLTWLTLNALNNGRRRAGRGRHHHRPGQLHPRHRPGAGPARHLRAGRAGDHQRVLDRRDSLLAARRAAPLPGDPGQGPGLRGAGARRRRDRRVRVVLHRQDAWWTGTS